MIKKTLKYITLATCGFGAVATIPVAVTAQQSKTNVKAYDEHDVVYGMVHQLESVGKQVVDFVNETNIIPENDKANFSQVYNLAEETLTPIFNKIIDATPRNQTHVDPLETFQDVLVKYQKQIMWGIEEIFDSRIVSFLIGREEVTHILDLWTGILNNTVDLETYEKNNWSLQDLFEGVLYPYCNNDREDAWKNYIFTVYGDNYYTGLNYNHLNGEEIQGTYELIQAPTYTSNFDWTSVQRGDIVFSDEGFAFGGYCSGHCAIVDGWYTAPVAGTNELATYLRVIEANEYGVGYGLLDDVRLEKEQMTVLHVANATSSQIEAAAKFCEAQLGKHYNIPIFLSEDTNPNAAAWYCSELVWAAYMNQGIDTQAINYQSIPGIIPWGIYYSDDTTPTICWDSALK